MEAPAAYALRRLGRKWVFHRATATSTSDPADGGEEPGVVRGQGGEEEPGVVRSQGW